ncbi:MAG: 4'-phosphopantetheinyl transferase superfamily protein [Paludibacteraceae bacterium]|nr:4'-phosphopantetheinyl transferase superfamily protein [Paludibacteraceae bacterium]
MKVMIFDRMEECTETEVQRLLPQVSAQRREQALRFKHTLGQFCCLKSWLMLNAMHIGEMEFLYNEHGKPYIEGGPFFSISHCKEGIAVAIDDQPVGIDIEAIRNVDQELILRTMNEEEQRQIHSNRDFTRLWTQKEAILKMEGTGITSFEQLQGLSIPDYRIQTIEKEKYIYTIAYGKLHCIGA